jgi:hypothetical protein
MVGAEGFEGSFPSDRYAVFFVEFDCKTTQFERVARVLKRTLPSRIFSPMDSFSQDFRITSYHLIAPKIVPISPKVGAEGAYHSTLEKRTECLKRIIRRRAFSFIHFEGDLLAGLFFSPTQRGSGLQGR